MVKMHPVMYNRLLLFSIDPPTFIFLKSVAVILKSKSKDASPGSLLLHLTSK